MARTQCYAQWARSDCERCMNISSQASDARSSTASRLLLEGLFLSIHPLSFMRIAESRTVGPVGSDRSVRAMDPRSP